MLFGFSLLFERILFLWALDAFVSERYAFLALLRSFFVVFTPPFCTELCIIVFSLMGTSSEGSRENSPYSHRVLRKKCMAHIRRRFF